MRLGTFHTGMSFLGCIGKLMENSELAEVLFSVYAPNTVGHMLNGKAVGRAVRGHILVSDVLSTLLLEQTFPYLSQCRLGQNETRLKTMEQLQKM